MLHRTEGTWREEPEGYEMGQDIKTAELSTQPGTLESGDGVEEHTLEQGGKHEKGAGVLCIGWVSGEDKSRISSLICTSLLPLPPGISSEMVLTS